MQKIEVTKEQVLLEMRKLGSINKAAKALGISDRTARRILARRVIETPKKELEFEQPVKDRKTEIEELLLKRAADFQKKKARHLMGHERSIKVKTNGPIGILHLGDPHVDDDGCDIALLQQHVQLVKKTPGLYGASVGDITNNWVGRLGKLYAHQGTTTREAWMLAEWLIKSMPWVYLVRGNHDAWSGDGDPLDWITRGSVPVDAEYDARLRLEWPDGEEIRLWARHDFPGRSQWAKSHGQARAAVIGGYPADVLISGHRHCWESRSAERADGSVYHAIQVASYKKFDSYAAQLGYPDNKHGASVMTILDPSKEGPGRVRVEWDIEAGADYLTWLRGR